MQTLSSQLRGHSCNHPRSFRFISALALIAFVGLLVWVGALRSFAYAEDIDTDPVADEFQQEIERTAREYEEAKAAVASAKQALEENRARLSELEREIPLQQERSDSAARELYKIEQQSGGIVELLLSSESYFDFLTNLEYVSRATDANIHEISRLSAMKAEFDEKQSALKQAKRDADENADKANAALEAAKEARREAQRRAQEEARRQAEEAAVAAAAAATNANNASSQEQTNDGSSDSTPNSAKNKENGSSSSAQTPSDEADATSDNAEAEAQAPEPPSDDGANWDSDQAAFINEWAARIDSYLEGSPMAGQGKTFASAAWTYGVDPRWSPAISFTESSKGAYCFTSHNAWGWGSASWGSWEEAIDAHVSGLARGYGYTISIDSAKKYCPPNWQSWYDRTLAQMNLI